VKWRSIKGNVRFSPITILRYVTFSSVRVVFGWSLPVLTHAHQPVYRLLSVHWAKLPTLFRKFCNNCLVSKTKFPLCLYPSFIFVQYFTHNQSYRPNCDYDLKYWRIYYKPKNNDVTKRWYLLLSYFYNKINFLFSCEIRSWSLRFRQFDICQVNTEQSNALVYVVLC